MSQPIQSCFERYEKKYFLTPAGQKALLQAISPYIKMDFYGKYTICNLYYDTPDWRLIRASLAKPVYKEKLRVRSYGVPAPDGKVFAELKKKYKGVVYKRRITVPAAEVQPLLAGQQSLADYGQIGREIAWFQQLYDARPRVFIGYDRIAFAGVADPELRITFDTNIRWRTAQLELSAGDHGAPLLPVDRVLLGLAVLAFVLLAGALLGLTALGFGEQKTAARVLKITIPENLDYDGLFDDIFAQYTRRCTLTRVKTSNMGTLYELEYAVTLPEEVPPKAFLDALRCRNGNLNITCGRESGPGMELL